MSDGELEARVTRLEGEVVAIRQDAAAARVLAGAADRDVSEFRGELRAHTQLLNALRATQVEQGQQIYGLGSDVGSLRTEMRAGFATLGAGMAQITAILTDLMRDEGKQI